MNIRKIWPLLAIAGVVAVLGLGSGITGAESDDELSVSSGKITIVTLPVEGATVGMLYFDITPTESGAPSAFKIDASNAAAVQIIAAARSGKLPVQVTYKSDFTVTEIEF